MDAFNFRLPKIAPNVCRRERLEAWLEFHAGVALRYVTAPAGAGKTTVAVLYARTRSHPVGYVAVAANTTPGDLYAQLAQSAGLGHAAGYRELLERLATAGRIELIVDDVDSAAPGVRHVLRELYRDVAEPVTLVYLARSPEALDFDGDDTRGLVATCDPGSFAFRADEIALFAQALGLDEDPMSIARLQRATLGWATAVAGVCLEAAANGRCVRDSQLAWHRRASRSLAGIVADATRCAPPDVAAEFTRVISGHVAGDQHRLRMFARYGLFVHEHDGRLTLNPLACAVARGEILAADARPTASATVEMFGRFLFAVEGKPLVWQRRRDRQIIAYLALQPDGRATRAQLIATFWPEADPQLAGQSLRTACSTIRRAFAAAVGPANVARYFVADHHVELKLDVVISSAARFQTHIAHADRAFDAGDARAAYAHYAAAEKLYVAPLLAGEPPAAWCDPHVARLAQMHRRCSERLGALLGCLTSDDVSQFRSIVAAHELSA